MGFYIEPTTIKFDPEEKISLRDGSKYVYGRYIEMLPFYSKGFGCGVTFSIKEKLEESIELKDGTLMFSKGVRCIFQIDFYEQPPQGSTVHIPQEIAHMVNSIIEHEVKGKTLEKFGWTILQMLVQQCDDVVKTYFPNWHSNIPLS